MTAEAPPESVEEALRRAARHGRNALAEALAACRAVLDAAALIATSGPARASAGFAGIASVLEALEAEIAPGASPSREHTGSLVVALAEALDAEIARWERRAERDPEARAVLRAFLGLRELLWELGVRADRSRSDEDDAIVDTDPTPDAAPRVQRIRVSS